MITISDNGATCSLIKVMHEHGGVDWLNQQTAGEFGVHALAAVGAS
jgi:hypothetical protein